MAKHKESAAVTAFKSKYGNAKKLFPNEETAALQAAEERNAVAPVKIKVLKKKAARKKKK